jgi:hypothetical protein
MRLLLFSILYLEINGLINTYKFQPLIKPITNLYQIKPFSTIIYYNVDNFKIMEIQDDINKKTNNRFTIKTNNIYVSLYEYSEDYLEENKSKCQLFVYVYDNLNNLDGQYILESTDYNKNNNDKSLITSFYEHNQDFCTSFSYYKDNLDNINYEDELKFNFIYENNRYLRNLGIFDKTSYIPRYIYSSELKFKDTHLKKSNKIIYYRNKFYFS